MDGRREGGTDGLTDGSRGQKFPSDDENQYSSRHLLCKCVYQIWRLYIIAEAINEEKLLWPIIGCKVGQSCLIVMKLTQCVALPTRCIYQVSIWYLKTWLVQKKPENFSLAGSSTNSHFRVFLVHQRAKNCPTMTKISRGQDTHYISVCTKS